MARTVFSEARSNAIKAVRNFIRLGH